jgi:hypothetical protein
VGLALSSALSITVVFAYGVSQSAELENQFVSVEIILEYTKVEPEAPLSILGK